MNALQELMRLAGGDAGHEAAAYLGTCEGCGRSMYSRKKGSIRPEGWVAKSSATMCFTCYQKNPQKRVLKPNCDECGITLRRRGEPRREGARLRQSDGVCQSCYKRAASRARSDVKRRATRSELEARTKAIVELRKQGLTRDEIQDRTGYSRSAVGRALALAGLTSADKVLVPLPLEDRKRAEAEGKPVFGNRAFGGHCKECERPMFKRLTAPEERVSTWIQRVNKDYCERCHRNVVRLPKADPNRVIRLYAVAGLKVEKPKAELPNCVHCDASMRPRRSPKVEGVRPSQDSTTCTACYKRLRYQPGSRAS